MKTQKQVFTYLFQSNLYERLPRESAPADRMQSAGWPKSAVPSTNGISIFSILYFELSALAR